MLLKVRQNISDTSKNVEQTSESNNSNSSVNNNSKVVKTLNKENLPGDIFSDTERAAFETQASSNTLNPVVSSNTDIEKPAPEDAVRIVVPGERSRAQAQTGIPGLDDYLGESNDEEYKFPFSMYEEESEFISYLTNIYLAQNFNIANVNLPNNYYNFSQFSSIFNPTGLSSILTKSLNSKPELDIKILSHEILKINNSKINDSNLLFMSKNDLNQKKFESIRNSEINKCESINDRFVQYINVSSHSDLVSSNIIKSKNIVNRLDKITSFSNKHEKQINYGNIIEDFILSNNSIYNGKIINTLVESNNSSIQDFYITNAGGSDERLLDKQDKSQSSVLSLLDLKIFYNNISGFDFREKRENIVTSLLNSTIINSDKLVGQMLLNQSIGMYSLYPNTDNISSDQVLEKRSRLNTNALNRFPIIQVANLNLNSRIFNDSNFEIINVKGGAFNKSNIPFQESDPLNSYLNSFNSYYFLITKNSLISIDDDNYYQRSSVAGKSGIQGINPRTGESTRAPIFDRNVFKINLKSSNNEKSVFETLYSDSDTNFIYKSPTFYIFPERYFMSNLIKFDMIDDDNNETRRFNSSNNEIELNEDNDDIINKIKEKIKQRFFNNFIHADNSGPTDLKNWLSKIGSFYEKYLENRLASNYLTLFKNSYKSTGNINSDGEYNLNVVDTNISQNSALERLLDIGISNIESNSGNIESTEDRVQRQLPNLSSDEDLIVSSNNTVSQIKEQVEIKGILGLKSDVFVFECSNSFLDKQELETFSFNVQENGSLLFPFNTLSKGSQSYIKTNKEKLLNYNSFDSKYTTSMYIYNGIATKSNVSFSKLSLLIANSTNIVKRKLGSLQFPVFNSFIEKCKSKIKQSNEFVLLYDKFEENSLDTFENSDFIEDGFYKNNFVKEFSNVKNTSKSYFNNEIKNNNHLFTSKEYREFLSKIYTKSFLRDNVTLLKRILKDNIEIFKSKNTYESDEYFGFDILLATTLSNKNNSDSNNIKKIIKLILSNAILKSAGLENQIIGLNLKQSNLDTTNKNSLNYTNFIFYDKLEKIYSKDFIEEVVSSIYDQKNIHCQKNYVIRKLKTFENENDFVQSMTSSTGAGGVRLNSINGDIHTLLFPLKYEYHKKPSDIEFFKNVSEIGSENRGDLFIFSNALKTLTSNLAYNYDVFIDKEKTGISFYEVNEETNQTVGAGYNFSKDNQSKGSDLKISYFNYSKPNILSDKSTPVRIDPDNENSSTRTEFLIGGDDKPVLPYTNKDVIIPFSYFYLSNRDNTYSNKITKICQDILEIFNVNYDDINNVDDVLNFIDQNEFYLRLLQDIFESYANVFLDSYENFLTLLVHKINNSNENIASYSSFVSGDSDVLKESAVSDLVKISNKINSNNKKFIEGNLIYTVDNFNNERDDFEIFTKRSQEIQNTFKILNNSDLASAICHDIIHGYFLNYEDNIQARNNNLPQFSNNVEFILSNVNKINNYNIDKKDMIDLLQNEFYQNILSKELQEIMYYKNIFNETFIKNNMFNTLKEKYEAIDLFNNKKLFYRNKYNQALSGFNTLANLVSNNNTEKLDIIRIPISYDVAKNIGERGILQIDILPVNLKYPEIEYSKLTFYYCPVLTNVTSNYGLSISNLFNNFIGFYDDTQKISERYSVVSKETARFEIRKIVEEILIRSAEQSIQTQSLSLTLSNRIVNDAIMSNAIKSINFISQKNLDENIKNVNFDVSNLVDYDTTNLFSSLDISTLKKIFNSYKKTTNEFRNLSSDTYFNLDSNNNIISNNDFYKKFIVNMSEDTSCSNILKNLIPNVYYDVFNIAINRAVIPKEDEDNVVNIRNSGINNDLQANKSFNYYISTKVV